MDLTAYLTATAKLRPPRRPPAPELPEDPDVADLPEGRTPATTLVLPLLLAVATAAFASAPYWRAGPATG